MEQGTCRIGLIGVGAVGTTLARAVAAAGYAVTSVLDQASERAVARASEFPGCQATEDPQRVVESADLVFLTVPDDVIEATCTSIRWTPGGAAIHCSGALSLDILSSAADAGAQVGSFHPMQTFAGAEDATYLQGCLFGIEAADPLRPRLETLTQRIGGWSLPLSAHDKARYHLAGVMASNYLVTLIGEAVGILEGLGLTEKEAVRALMPLMSGTVRNLESSGVPGALTGPIARGDAGTVQRHSDVLRTRHPELQSLYEDLGERTVRVARDAGRIDTAAADRILQILGHSDSTNHSTAEDGGKR